MMRWCAISLLLAAAQAQGLPACQPVQAREGGGAVLERPGRYCVRGDMLVDSRYRLFAHGSHYKADDRILILIATGDSVLDLQQHTVTANAALRAAIESPGEDWKNYPDAGRPILPANLTIRNGKIRVTKRASTGLGIKILSTPGLPASVASDFSDRWRARDGGTLSLASARLAEEAAIDLQRALPARAQDYPARGIVIEQVQIRSAGSGIAVQGAGTVIRNSTIEVDAGTAIWIYGPNAVIENNTIIVHASAGPLDADAAIRLHHGDGALIRNNRIILKGRAHEWAVSVFKTGAVTMEGNTVNGSAAGKHAVRKLDGSRSSSK